MFTALPQVGNTQNCPRVKTTQVYQFMNNKMYNPYNKALVASEKR